MHLAPVVQLPGQHASGALATQEAAGVTLQLRAEQLPVEPLPHLLLQLLQSGCYNTMTEYQINKECKIEIIMTPFLPELKR